MNGRKYHVPNRFHSRILNATKRPRADASGVYDNVRDGTKISRQCVNIGYLLNGLPDEAYSSGLEASFQPGNIDGRVQNETSVRYSNFSMRIGRELGWFYDPVLGSNFRLVHIGCWETPYIGHPIFPPKISIGVCIISIEQRCDLL